MLKGKTIILLGAGIMQIPVIKIALEEGVSLHVFDGNPEAPGREQSPHFHLVDISRKEEVFEAAAKLHKQYGLDGIFTAGTDFSTSVAYATEKLGLPGISYETAIKAKDKGVMRRVLKDAGIPVPQFQLVTHIDQPIKLPFPLVVKPVDSMGARGVQLVENEAEARLTVQESLAFSLKGEVILEEYLEGPEYSLDSLIYKDKFYPCGLADRDIRFEPYFIEMGHLLPSECSRERACELWDILEKTARVLGIDHGAAKGDIKWTSRGPVIGEVAARLSGGYMSGWTYPYAAGRSSILGGLRLAVGLDPSLEEERPDPLTAVERAFISVPGQVKEILGVEKVKETEGVKDFFLLYKKGDVVGFPKNNVEKGGNIIFLREGLTPMESLKAARAAAAQIVFRLEVDNAHTEDFLFGEHPPLHPNFTLNEKWKNHIAASPAATRPLSAIPFLPHPIKGNDWQNRSAEEALEQISQISGLPRGKVKAGQDFWLAFFRGSVQGALWILDGEKKMG